MIKSESKVDTIIGVGLPLLVLTAMAAVLGATPSNTAFIVASALVSIVLTICNFGVRHLYFVARKLTTGQYLGLTVFLALSVSVAISILLF